MTAVTTALIGAAAVILTAFITAVLASRTDKQQREVAALELDLRDRLPRSSQARRDLDEIVNARVEGWRLTQISRSLPTLWGAPSALAALGLFIVHQNFVQAHAPRLALLFLVLAWLLMASALAYLGFGVFGLQRVIRSEWKRRRGRVDS